MTTDLARCPSYLPHTELVELTAPPRLASWDAAAHPAQRALSHALDQAERDLVEHLDAPAPWALELVVGLPATTPLLVHHDLDNYLLPLAARLGGHRLVSARARKRHGECSEAGIATAQPSKPTADRTVHCVRTTASAGTSAYKQQVHDQLAASGARPVTRGAPVSAVIGFRCGPGRNWLNLWKPTIDALGPLIGEGERMWSPRDGAIVELALHVSIDPTLRWDVEVFVGVAPAPAPLRD